MTNFNIKSANSCRYDAVSLGEIMMRIDPIDVPMARARTVRVWHGGGEANVVEGLSYCFGMRSAVVTALLDDSVGRNIENQLREAGVDVSHIVWFNNKGEGKFSTDQKGTLHNGIHFTWAGKGVLPPVTEYYRAYTPISRLKAGDIDWKAFFSQGVRWFHTGGIYALISPSSSEVVIEAMEAAGKAGTFRSYDLNYRSRIEPDKKRAQKVNKRIVSVTDFLVGNQSDFEDALGEDCRKVDKNEPFEIWLEAYSELLRKIAKKYPNIKLIGTHLRSAEDAYRIKWGTMIYDTAENKICQSVVRENVQAADRTGGGDAFVSGVAAGLLLGRSVQDAVQLGAAHCICVLATPGDTSMVKQADVEAEVKRALGGNGIVNAVR